MQKNLEMQQVTFVHSLFRAGSTYFYNALKRTGKCHIYHEPFHEIIAELPSDLEKWDNQREYFKQHLRHDFLQGGYFDEYRHLLPLISENFDKNMSFKLFFLENKDNAPALKRYIDALISSSPKSPILQCTRTIGRVGWLRSKYRSKNIFLLRNPWDQWYSYKVDDYISNTPRVIYSQPNVPVVLVKVMEACGFCALTDKDIEDLFACYASAPADPRTDYFLFFGLWLYAFVSANQKCDLIVDMDLISRNERERATVQKKCANAFHFAVNLHDCKLHRTLFKNNEMQWYKHIEDRVFEIFRPLTDANSLKIAGNYLSAERHNSFIASKTLSSHLSNVLEDASRLRKLVANVSQERQHATAASSQALAEREGQVGALSEAVKQRDAQIAGLSKTVAEREGQINALNKALGERDAQIGELSQELEARGDRIEGLNRSMAEREEQVGALSEAVKQRDAQIAGLSKTVAEREGQINALNKALGERDAQIGKLNRELQARDGLIERLNQSLTERDGQIGALSQELKAREGRIEGLTQSLADSEGELRVTKRAIGERDAQFTSLRHEITKADDIIASWQRTIRRISAPFRLAKRLFISICHPLRANRLARDVRIIRRSGLFDTAFYLSNYRDIRLNTCNPIRHYCQFGWREGRNPSPEFDTSYYLRSNLDVADSGVNPLVHYFKYGIKEGRFPRDEEIGVSVEKQNGWTKRSNSQLSLFSRISMAICILPATFLYYGGAREWLRAVGRGKAFFVAVLIRPAQIHERLVQMPIFVRILIAVPLSAALRIQKNGGVLPALRNMYRVSRSEGKAGVLSRLTEQVPLRVTNAVASSNPFRILVMDYRIPMADISAGERATVGILNSLSAFGFEVVFLPNNMVSALDYEEDLRRVGIQIITSAMGYQSSIHYLSEQGHTFAAFYLIRVDVAETALATIRRVAPQARVVFHAPDVYFLRESREAELKRDSKLRDRALATRERELTVMRQVDHIVLVSQAELPVLRRYLPEAPVSVFPVLYAPVVTKPRPFTARKDIFFLGGFAHTPNVDAVCWFVAEVWPLVKERLPNAVFHVVGSEAPQEVKDLQSVPGVMVDGFVKNLDSLLSEMRVGVAPIRFGAGIKGKVGVTMGAGIPCVCTSIAAEGMGLEDGLHVSIADDPQVFADRVERLYTDREYWRRLSQNGKDFVVHHFGEEANRKSLLRILNEARILPLQLYSNYCKAIVHHAVPDPGKDDDVDVSVIIPVYNHWELTRACISSVLEACEQDAIRYEIILADDGSSDETVRAARYFPGLHVVKTPKNVGFLRNCNNAAKHARGKYLLLLNNDTVVLPGWMKPLYRLMHDDTTSAIVGSKLLYPDGVIQEAGGLLFGDGTGYNAGRGQYRDALLFNILRETDYVSGASMLVRSSFWKEVGGFDEHYKNAYCEDSDLAMTARSRGLRVLYQPLSEVIHFEHGSYAEQAPTHDTTLQRHNIDILVKKWRATFARDHLTSVPWHLAMSNAERAAPPATLARRRKGKLNVLYFSPFPSHPACHGNRATIQEFGRHFQTMGHRVHFALLQSHDYSNDDLKTMREFWDTVDVIPFTHPMLADGNPIAFDGWYEEGLGERIRYLCSKYEIDVVFCSYVFQSRLLEFIPNYILKVIDTHDKMGNRYDMLRSNGQPLEFFSCTPEEEGAYLRRADIVIARRDEEAHYFDEVSGRSTAITIPHIESPHFMERVFARLRNVGMVASPNRINLTIVSEFLEALERRTNGETYSVTVHIAGKVKDMVTSLQPAKRAIFQRPWVQMHGFVPDISQFYRDMDLIVSPVTMGTGINVKTVQAMAYGMPILTTAVGSKGIETGDEKHGYENLDTLADGLLALLNHPEELQHLAAISRERYTTFYKSGSLSMREIFLHTKLQGNIGDTGRRSASNEAGVGRESGPIPSRVFG